MLEIKFVIQNFSQVKKALLMRGETADIEILKDYDSTRRAILLETEELRHRRNLVSQQVADMKKAGKNTYDLVVEMRDVSSKIKALDKPLSENS